MIKLISALVILFSACGQQSSDYSLRAGTIRQSGGTWYILDDEDHTPSGLLSVEQNDSSITVYFAPCLDILTSSITPDETLAKNDITVGGSVGLDRVTIWISEDPSTLTYPHSNIWIEIICNKGAL